MCSPQGGHLIFLVPMLHELIQGNKDEKFPHPVEPLNIKNNGKWISTQKGYQGLIDDFTYL